MTQFFRWLFLCFCFVHVHSHVALTFPPARYPPLDFLDSINTQGPCGVPKSEKYVTLVGGETYNITWRMSYPHRGGYKIYLLSANGKPLGQLSDWNGSSPFTGTNDQTVNFHSLKLPATMSCFNCTIQLERQAKEWGPAYWFWSCADVNIVPSGQPVMYGRNAVRYSVRKTAAAINNCMGNGRLTANGQCDCYPRFSGKMCQYEDDCANDQDCSGRGRCVDLQNSQHPSKVCFCAPSYFGQKCEKQFRPLMADVASNCFNYGFPRSAFSQGFSASSYAWKYNLFNPSCYDKTEVSTEDIVYWRKIDDQMEVILETKGKSWVGLGWRPKDTSSECQRFPVDSRKPDKIDKTAFQKNLIQKTKWPVADPENTAKNQQPIERKTEQTYNWNNYVRPAPVFVRTRTWNWYQGRNTGRKRRSTWRGVRRQQTWQPISWYKTQSPPQYVHPSSRAQPAHPTVFQPKIPEPEAEPEPKAKPEPQATSEIRRESNMHPMDCTDMVIGAAMSDHSYVGDYYTRDRSTPLRDSVYGGTDNLMAAYALETYDGKTVIMFRKPVSAFEQADQGMGPGPMHVIWAKGQEAGNFSHSPLSALETNPVGSQQSYYTPKKLMYHGNNNRRVLNVEFFARGP